MAKITRKQFTRKHRDHAVAVNVRLKKTGGDKPKKAEVLDVLEEIMRTSRVPNGWKFAAIDWRRPSWSSGYWRHGKIGDLMGNLSFVLPFMLEDARVGLVRGTEWELEIGMEY